eukprot:2270774-Rhodomonas_salina.1
MSSKERNLFAHTHSHNCNHRQWPSALHQRSRKHSPHLDTTNFAPGASRRTDKNLAASCPEPPGSKSSLFAPPRRPYPTLSNIHYRPNTEATGQYVYLAEFYNFGPEFRTLLPTIVNQSRAFCQ